MATANFYSHPSYARGGGTAEAPRLGATSDNISGYDKTTAGIVKAVKEDAAKNGLTAWGFSFLRQLGEAIKPEWLKESSRAWFNKPLVDPLIPPKEDFLKLVEPAVLNNTANYGKLSPGIVTEAIRDDAGFGGLWKKYHAEVGDLDEQYSRLPEYLDPKRQEAKITDINAAEAARIRDRYADVIAKYGVDPATTPQWKLQAMEQGSRFDGMPDNYTPGVKVGQAKIDADTLAANEAHRATISYQPIDEDNPPAGMTRQQARQRNREMNAQAEANFQAGHMGADDVLKARAGDVPATPLVPGTPGGERIDSGTYQNGVFVPSGSVPPPPQIQNGVNPTVSQRGGPQTLLPPYLQPGGGNNIAGGVQGVLNRYNTGVLPPQQTVNPLAPLMPVNPLMPAVGQIPLGMPTGSPFPTGTNLGVGGINTGGGFGATAKLLELPYYLRNLNKPRARAGVAAYG